MVSQSRAKIYEMYAGRQQDQSGGRRVAESWKERVQQRWERERGKTVV